MAIRRWLDDQVSLEPLKDVRIAVIGYGIQGAAQASNMKDSGLSVTVGLRPDGKTWDKAVSEGHNVLKVEEAVNESDLIHILIPDMEQENTFKNEIFISKIEKFLKNQKIDCEYNNF